MSTDQVTNLAIFTPKFSEFTKSITKAQLDVSGLALWAPELLAEISGSVELGTIANQANRLEQEVECLLDAIYERLEVLELHLVTNDAGTVAAVRRQ